MKWTLARLAAVLSAPSFFLVGCASKSPTPVAERAAEVRVVEASGAAPAAPLAPAAAALDSAPTYLVKRGDTLYSIALDHGVDYKDLARWNALENPNLIRVGQKLRLTDPVAPPEATVGEGVVVKPVVAAEQLHETPSVSAPSAPSTAKLKRGPKGGKLPYSEAALAALKGDKLALAPPVPPAASAPLTIPAASAAAATPTATPPAAQETGGKPTAAAPAPQPVPAGALVWAWPAPGKILAPFNEAANKGVDLAGKLGDPVLAAASGKVSYVGSGLRGYGKMVVIKHSAEFLSVYAHNSKVLVTEGQTVSAGQKIAEIGDSDAEAPRLHFEIRRQGKPIDPVGVLPSR